MTDIDGIVSTIAEALRKRGYDTLTPVQTAMIDPDLVERDVLVSAQTGSGKTVAFGLALAPNLLEEDGRFDRAATPLALAIAPTRELAMQVKRELEWLYEMTGASLATCVGGMDVRTERRALERGAHIVVGTPGRLRDHITRGALDLSDLRAVVLDEADEMLDLGFREDLEFILEASPESRRTLMFSATVPRSIADLAKTYQRDARRVETVSEKKQHVDIEYRALVVANPDRENAIINVLRYYEAKNAIVFCSTRAAVNHLTARLHNRGFSVVALSGELTQNERTHALQAMRDGRARVCIATDVAARGIDLPGLELVIHADLPTNSETLLHRSGRTGRAGNKGVSALIVPMSARRKAERLLMGASVQPTWALPPTADEVIERDNERLLIDPSLNEAVTDDEAPLVARLLEAHGAEKLAAAFLRLQSGHRSAPEDLIPVTLEQQRKRREGEDFPVQTTRGRDADFGPSRWFSLAVGRNQRAEPRWLIPMLCRHGNLTKRDIGRIKLMQEETFVEIAEASAESFLVSLGPNKTIDRGINVRPVDGMPDFAAPERERTPRPPRDNADRARRDRDDAYDKAPRKDWKKDKPSGGDFAGKKPYAGKRRDDDMRKADDEVWGDTKPAAEKPFRKSDDNAPWKKAKPAGGKSAFAGRDNGDRRGDKPAYAGKPKGGPGGKGKPGGKPFGGKPFKGKKKG